MPVTASTPLLRTTEALSSFLVYCENKSGKAGKVGGVNDYDFGKYPKQEKLLASVSWGTVAIGGNRVGKTTAGGCELVWRHLGRHPFKQTHRPPIRSWCCSQTLPGNDDKPHVQLDEVRRWAPPGALRGGSWERAYSPASRSLHWANGGITEFKSYDQAPLQFESAKLHFVWFDEEPVNKTIWTSCTARLIDYGGDWWLTLTPILSLEASGWVEETLWDRKAELEGEIDFYEFSMRDNPYLSPEYIERFLGNLGDGDERQIREFGMFAKLGGRVLSEYDPGRHRVRWFQVPGEWRHYFILDFGYRNPTAAIFAAVDPHGDIWLYCEHYRAGWRPKQHMVMLHEYWKAFGSPEVICKADPSGFNLKRDEAGREQPAVIEEFKAAAAEIGATWFRPKPADNSDRFALRVKRYLATGKLHVFDHLDKWDWEARKWGYKLERKGTIAAAEKERPEEPVDRDDHLMDCHPAGTLIATAQGDRPIETLKAGDLVWTRDGLKPVQAAWETGERETATILFEDGSELIATLTHPVWTVARGWVAVRDLKGGEECLRRIGIEVAPVAVRAVCEHGKRSVVYNLQVADRPEYFANGVLVHNCTRYLVNELPDPLPAPPVFEPWSPEKVVREHLERAVKRKERASRAILHL